MQRVFHSFIGLGLAVLLAACSNSLDQQIIGKWKYRIEMNLADKDSTTPPKMTLDCNDEIFPNKSISHECKFTLIGDTKGASGESMKMEMRGNLNAAGEWSINEKTVYDKTVDGKIELTEFIVNGSKVTDQSVLSNIQNQMQSPFIKGATTKMKSISIDKEKWSYEIEFENKPVNINATRI
jgi:hypothetical protein